MAGFELEGIEEVEGDSVLDIKVCSNRGDGLSVFGLAREVLAKYAGSRPTELYERAKQGFSPHPLPAIDGQVTIESSACTRYAAMGFEGIAPGKSPEWMQQRLRQAGMRPLGLIVDLTNYVMLELGQPMHAFDRALVDDGAIVVREAKDGETITTLNGLDHSLQLGQLMICDRHRPIAVAGVMGGQDTEVGSGTTAILLESAHFVNTSVRRTRKQLGLSTEASYRFERSVDPAGVVAAQWRFAELLQSAGGPAPSSLTDVWPSRPPAKTIEVRLSRATRLLGMQIGATDAKGYLERLGMLVEGDGQPFRVTVPSWRFDLFREDDLVEELGRVHGYELIPEELPRGATVLGGAWGDEAVVDRLRSTLVAQELVQVISHSLRGVHPLDSQVGERIGPRNVADPEMRYLRSSLLPGLAEAALRNRGERIGLFEQGRVFAGRGGESFEARAIAFMAHGPLLPASFGRPAHGNADFYDAKRWIEAIAQSLGVALSLEAGPDHRFHPTRHASSWNGLAVFGQVHPELAEEIGIPEATVMGEVVLEPLLSQGTPWLIDADVATVPLLLSALSRNPAVRRDIALLIAKSVPYGEVQNAIEEAGGVELERHWLFDVYAGAGIPEGHHSLAIALLFRRHGANFTDEEANQARDRVVSALQRLGATLR